MICFFRGFYDDVPGCLGAGEEDHDYCVDPFLTPVLAAEAPSNTSSFQLKLYWQEGYTWQEVRSLSFVSRILRKSFPDSGFAHFHAFSSLNRKTSSVSIPMIKLVRDTMRKQRSNASVLDFTDHFLLHLPYRLLVRSF